MASPQHITTRLATSEARFVTYPTPGAGAPNVVMVVLDDVGFAQLGPFGGGIATPNIDRLAAAGLRYNRFHVTSICSSTRAALLTGRNHHAVGMGLTQETVLGFPGYTGRIPQSAATLARILRDNGYNTMAVGKWHLAARGEYSASGPFERWPLGLGFERYYGFLGAETSQWAPQLVRDNTSVSPPRSAEDGYHLTEDLVDEAIAMIHNQQQAAARKPFFLYVAPGAMHAPHHVSEEWVAPYAGRFDDGWEAWRERAFARQLAEGIVPPGTVLTPRPPWVPAWESLSTQERRVFARYMEVFAGLLTHTDHHLGRLFDALDQRGIAGNTMVMVLSDNGASAEGGRNGTLNEAAAWMGVPSDVADTADRLADIGGHDTYNHYPFGWAWAGNGPMRLWKRYAWLGGVRTPLIVRWPARITDAGAVRPQFCHAVDVLPTVLAAAGVEAPTEVDGVAQQPIDGRSMLASFTDADAGEHRDLQYFEMCGSRGLYLDGWKVVTDHVANQFDERSFITGSHDFDTDRWSLFHLDSDFSESTDLAEQYPERVAEMERVWTEEAWRNQVFPMYEFPASLAHIHPGEFPPPAAVVLMPGAAPVVESQLPSTMGGFTLSAQVTVEHGATDGIITALGDHHGGWAFYVVDGRPTATFALYSATVRVSAPDPLAPGSHDVSLRYEAGRRARVVIAVDGHDVAEAAQPAMLFLPNISTAGLGMFVGRDEGLAVSADYRPPFAFAGTIHRVTLTSAAPGSRPDPDSEIRAAFAAD